MTTPFHDRHLSASGIQAFLDDALPSRERRRAEEHLAACPSCSAQLEGWSTVFRELDDLPRLVPHEGFRDRVMQDVHLPEPQPLVARLRDTLLGWLPGIGDHLSDGTLQDLVDGALPEAAATRVRAHLDGCRRCARSHATWRAVTEELNALGHLSPSPDFRREVLARWRLEEALSSLGHHAPSEGFAAAVMAGLEHPERTARPATAPAAAMPGEARPRAWPWDGAVEQLWAAASRWLPKSRKAWAALSGVAVTPAVTLGLVAWTVLSHPTLTAGSLASFAWWKLTDLTAAAWATVSAFAIESTGVFGLWETLGGLVASPGTVAAVGVALCVGSLASAWVLYRNLFAHPRGDGRYAHAHG